MTHQQTSECFEKAHCLVKNTVGLQEAENGALLCSMEIANKPRSKELCFGVLTCRITSNGAPLKGIKIFLRNFKQFNIDSIFAILNVFAPFPGV